MSTPAIITESLAWPVSADFDSFASLAEAVSLEHGDVQSLFALGLIRIAGGRIGPDAAAAAKAFSFALDLNLDLVEFEGLAAPEMDEAGYRRTVIEICAHYQQTWGRRARCADPAMHEAALAISAAGAALGMLQNAEGGLAGRLPTSVSDCSASRSGLPPLRLLSA